jgi:hypothetical protein|tara:strand:- start:121 stop:276 length:156 start_codon:yes stop_codon:yes gene_type:complete
MKNDIKDTLELWGVNISAIGISLTQIDAVLSTMILIASLIYSIQKIIKINK